MLPGKNGVIAPEQDLEDRPQRVEHAPQRGEGPLQPEQAPHALLIRPGEHGEFRLVDLLLDVGQVTGRRSR